MYTYICIFFRLFSTTGYCKILNIYLCYTVTASLVAQTIKNLPAMQETWLRSLGQEDPLEEEIKPLQCSCLENPLARRAWRATVHRVAELDMTEAT